MSIAERYKNGLIALRQEHEKHPSGLKLAQKRSDLLDEIITALFESALTKSGVATSTPDLRGIAIVATGGYGRRELSPFSDIDLMVLHGLRDKVLITQISENLFYPLWDLGLIVGHGTRTVKESLAMAAANFELQTAFLEARLVAGDGRLVEELQRGLLKQLQARGGKRFFQSVLNENNRRHAQYGQTAYLLEPDLKEGEGGLRDLQAILWVAKGLLGAATLKELAQKGHLIDFDADSLEQAHEFMLTVRNHLHNIVNRKTDRLFFEYQEEISKALGFKDSNSILAIERLMRSFYMHASTVERVSRSFWTQVRGEFEGSRWGVRPSARSTDRGIAIMDGKVSLASSESIATHPGSEVKLFARSLQQGLELDFRNLGLIREGLIRNDSPAQWTPEILEDFKQILGAGEAAIPTLETMDHLGLLTRYIPEWANVQHLPQHDSYHLYTVDMHLFRTIAELHNIAIGRYEKSNPLLKQVYDEIERKDILLVTGLLHDIGKGNGKGHSERGAKMAKEIAARMGYSQKDAKIVSLLVEQHLLLSDTALRRDLNDENLMIDLAALVIKEDVLRMLYLLTVTDSLATGPKAWDIWKDNLLRELFTKILHIIQSGEYTSKKSIDRMKKTANKVTAALTGRFDEKEIDLFLKQMPHSYLLAHSSDDIVEHFIQMQATGEGISVEAKSKAGVCELVLIAKDRPGLFSKVAGVLALHGLNILGAQIYTRNNGIALDIFKVAGYFENTLSEDTWAKIQADIKRALEGKISLEYRIAEKAQRYQQSTVLGKPPEVKIDNSSSDFYTVVEVHAQDRIGLLYTITRIMRDLNLDIHLAKVSTNVDKVIDVFYVWDTYGQKIYDEEHTAEIKRAIQKALE